MSRGKFRLRNLAIALAALLVAQEGISLLLRLHSVRQALRSVLEQAIGRHVEVSRFDLSLWGGPRLQALYVTVEEDPESGAEFLLRADRLDAQPDWRALLRGRLAFSRIWLERPSLNLVRAPSGRWNYQDWESMRPSRADGFGGVPSGAAHLTALTIRDGRINFKRGPEKLPFALLEVNGSLSARSDGRWNISLRAQPFRAGVTLQDPGAIQFEGSLPSASAAIAASAPADLTAHWEKASLPDALRLAFGQDFGVRGKMEITFTLHTPPPAEVSATPRGAASTVARIPDSPGRAASGAPWNFSGVLRLADVHRWDLPLAPGLPALILSVEGTASRDRRRLEFSNILLEGPRSQLRGRAFFDRDAAPQASLRVVTASIRLEDLLVWYRAFHPGVNPQTSLEGYLGADVEVQGWPPAVVRAALVTTGARLILPGARGRLLLRRTVLEADRAGARLNEASLSFGENDPGVRFSGKIAWGAGLPFTARLAGATDHFEELSAAIAALALAPPVKPIQGVGSASLRLNWTGFARPWQVTTLGTASFENLRVSGGILRSEVTAGSARLDFLPHQRRLQFASLKAFGGTWNGSMLASSLAGPWEFRLAVDRLVPAQLVRGFSSEPPENSSLLSRILPPQAAATVAREEPRWPAWLRGEGTISAGTLAVGRLELERLKGRLNIVERGIALEDAQAALAGGLVRGEARAVFGGEPKYAIRAEFDGINVGAVAALTAPTRQCCTGTASGHLEFNASGWNRDALLASLKGSGSARVRSGALLTLDLPATLAGGNALPGRTPLKDLAGDFSFANGHAWLDHMILSLPSGQVEAQGNADFQGQLDLRISPGGTKRTGASAGGARLQLKGTLAAPKAIPAAKPSS